MAQRSTAPRDPKIIRRTLHWFWWVTKKRPFAAFMAVFTSVAYTALLNYANTYVMSRIVDRISARGSASGTSLLGVCAVRDCAAGGERRRPSLLEAPGLVGHAA